MQLSTTPGIVISQSAGGLLMSIQDVRDQPASEILVGKITATRVGGVVLTDLGVGEVHDQNPDDITYDVALIGLAWESDPILGMSPVLGRPQQPDSRYADQVLGKVFPALPGDLCIVLRAPGNAPIGPNDSHPQEARLWILTEQISGKLCDQPAARRTS